MMTFSPNHPCANELASMMTLQREVHHLRKQIDKMKNCHNCKSYTSKPCLSCKRSMSLFDTDNWEMKND